MKNGIGSRGILILVVLALSLWSVWPSIKLHRLSGDVKQEFMKQNPKDVAKAVNFGLDLAGGTNIVVEIDKSGLKPDDAADVQERSLEIIRNRVDQFGLSEPVITPSGANRVVAELAGVDAEQAKGLIGETALLEFKLVVKQDRFVQVLNLIDEYLKRKSGLIADTAKALDTTKVKADSALAKKPTSDADLMLGGSALKDSTKKDTSKVALATATVDSSKKDTSSQSRFTEDLAAFKQRPFTSMLRQLGGDIAVAEGDVARIQRVLDNPAMQAVIPLDVQFAWGHGFEVLQNGDKVKKLYMLKRRAEMDGKEVSDASPHRIQGGLTNGELGVNLKFKGLGPKKFASVTGNNIGRQMAIVLDNQVISAPVIRDRIADGNAQITGLKDMGEAKQLGVVLRAGALPAPMKIVELRSVGASLGEDNIRNGIISAVVGIGLVLVFMMLYYHVAGVIANIAVLFNVVLVGAIMSLFHATLTLPGIAGMVLTVGMAVDANVIIYERIREEQRAGKAARAAVSAGYERAFNTIIDSHVTTFLTALILYKIGTGSVKGFGLTLMIGIAASLFTALTVTRSIFDGMLNRSEANKLNVGKGLNFLNHANLPVMPKKHIFVGVSLFLLAASTILCLTKGFDKSIDFTGGQVLTVQFQDQAHHSLDLQGALKKVGVTEAKVRTVGGTQANQYLITIKGDASAENSIRKTMTAALQTSNLQAEIINEELVGPSISKELTINAILSVLAACLVIALYIWFRFGKFGLGFGFGAVIALMHDTLISLGLISLLGLPIDATLIAAVLTIIGYSISDTVVVYDRIRENTKLHGTDNFEMKINEAVNQSFSRTIISSLTVFFVTMVLGVSGGASIQDFGIVMSFGVIVGTWSSIFIASPFVLWWTKRFPAKTAK